MLTPFSITSLIVGMCSVCYVNEKRKRHEEGRTVVQGRIQDCQKEGPFIFFLPLVFPTPNGILIVKKISEKSSDSRLSGGGEIIFCN